MLILFDRNERVGQYYESGRRYGTFQALVSGEDKYNWKKKTLKIAILIALNVLAHVCRFNSK